MLGIFPKRTAATSIRFLREGAARVLYGVGGSAGGPGLASEKNNEQHSDAYNGAGPFSALTARHIAFGERLRPLGRSRAFRRLTIRQQPVLASGLNSRIQKSEFFNDRGSRT
jgi:hypothetical protein